MILGIIKNLTSSVNNETFFILFYDDLLKQNK